MSVPPASDGQEPKPGDEAQRLGPLGVPEGGSLESVLKEEFRQFMGWVDQHTAEAPSSASSAPSSDQIDLLFDALDWVRALDALQRRTAQARAQGNEWLICHELQATVELLIFLGRIEEALRCSIEANEIARRGELPPAMGMNGLLAEADLRWRSGDAQRALACLEEAWLTLEKGKAPDTSAQAPDGGESEPGLEGPPALDATRAISDLIHRVAILSKRARVHLESEHLGPAEEALHAAWILLKPFVGMEAEQNGVRMAHAGWKMVRARLRAAQGQDREAIGLCREAVACFRWRLEEHGYQPHYAARNLAVGLDFLASLEDQAGLSAESKSSFDEAQNLRRTYQIPASP